MRKTSNALQNKSINLQKDFLKRLNAKKRKIVKEVDKKLQR
jgi:hypothetical protein